MKLKGNDVIIFVKIEGEWKTLALGTSCELDVNAETKEVSSPDTGKWVKTKKGRISWGGSSAHLLSYTNQINVQTLLESADAVKMMIGSVEATDDVVDYRNYVPDGRFGLKGMIHITRLTMNANKDGFTSLQIQFEGTGKFEDIHYPVLFVPVDADSVNMVNSGELYVDACDIN